MNLNVFVLLPMHWLVISFGIAFGWRRGLFLAILAPVSSMIFTGKPFWFICIPMIFELAAYSAIPSLTYNLFKNKDNKSILSYILIILSIPLALVTGRILYFIVFNFIIGKQCTFISLFVPATLTIVIQSFIFAIIQFYRFKRLHNN